MIILDAGVVIAQFAEADPHSQAAFEILDTEEELGIRPITLGESLVHSARSGDEASALAKVARIGIEQIRPGVDQPVELARLRARTALKMPDCCVLVAAQQVGGTVATFDKRLADAARDLGLTPDPYAGYFEGRAGGDEPARTSFWGSFGDVGAVASIRNEDQTLPAGRYDVEVVCVGPPTGVDLTLTSIGDGVVVREVNVGCTADGIVGRVDTIETAAQGLRIELDSGGSAGAYLVNVRDAAG